MEDLTVIRSLISLNCHEVIIFNSILGNGTHELHGAKYFTPKANQSIQIIFEGANCLHYFLRHVHQKLFPMLPFYRSGKEKTCACPSPKEAL